jgi:hypothetical protein
MMAGASRDKTSVRMAGVSVEIRLKYLPCTILVRYCYSNVLSPSNDEHYNLFLQFVVCATEINKYTIQAFSILISNAKGVQQTRIVSPFFVCGSDVQFAYEFVLPSWGWGVEANEILQLRRP